MSNICILTLTFGGSVQSRSTASFSFTQPGSESSTHLPFDVTGKSFSTLEAGICAGSRAWIAFSASLSFFHLWHSRISIVCFRCLDTTLF